MDPFVVFGMIWVEKGGEGTGTVETAPQVTEISPMPDMVTSDVHVADAIMREEIVHSG